MDGALLTTAVCIGLIGTFGVAAFKAWLNKKALDARADLAIELSDRETERKRILKEALDRSPGGPCAPSDRP